MAVGLRISFRIMGLGIVEKSLRDGAEIITYTLLRVLYYSIV